MKIRFLLLSLFALNACAEKGVDGYVNWYEKKPSAVYNQGSRKFAIKEYPRELGWLAFYGKSGMTAGFLDSLNKTEDQHIQLLVNIEDTVATPSSVQPSAFGRYSFAINNLLPLDVRPLGTGTQIERYLVVFQRKEVNSTGNLSISGPDGKKIAIPISSILIKEKRKLRI